MRPNPGTRRTRPRAAARMPSRAPAVTATCTASPRTDLLACCLAAFALARRVADTILKRQEQRQYGEDEHHYDFAGVDLADCLTELSGKRSNRTAEPKDRDYRQDPDEYECTGQYRDQMGRRFHRAIEELVGAESECVSKALQNHERDDGVRIGFEL